VKPRCGPFFSIGKTAVCRLIYIAKRQAAAQLQRSGCIAPKTGGLYRGCEHSRLPRRNKDDVKEVATGSRVPASGLRSFRQLARQGSRRALKLVTPAAHPEHQLKRREPAQRAPALGPTAGPGCCSCACIPQGLFAAAGWKRSGPLARARAASLLGPRRNLCLPAHCSGQPAELVIVDLLH